MTPPNSPISDANAQFAQPLYVTDPTTCHFYHTMELPTVGVMQGEWDLRGDFSDYTNSYDFKGKRVLDIGAGSGFLSFSAEAAGAREVVSFDMDDSRRQDFLPFHNNLSFKDRHSFAKMHNAWIAQWRHAYWLGHRLLNSKAHVYYGDVYALPAFLGQFDVVIIGSVLEHLADPIKALGSISRVTAKSMIIVTPMLDTDRKVAEFQGDCERPDLDFVFWAYSRGVYYHVLSMLGFRIDAIVERAFKFELDGGKRHTRHVISATRE